jgi:hypothetical protein
MVLESGMVTEVDKTQAGVPAAEGGVGRDAEERTLGLVVCRQVIGEAEGD